MTTSDPRRSSDADDPFGAVAPVPAPPGLRARVLALGESPQPAPGGVREAVRTWWPWAATVLVVLVGVLLDRAVTARFERTTAPPSPGAELQPYGPDTPLPLDDNSWARLRPAEVTP